LPPFRFISFSFYAIFRLFSFLFHIFAIDAIFMFLLSFRH
jgi:hypothetical protein